MAGIYLHIPFCKQACHYCDFHFSTNRDVKEDMVKALGDELLIRKDYVTEPIETIYFGGGTPSLLKENELRFLLDLIRRLFNVRPDAEITLEANPDDLISDNLKSFIDLGINRLSIGIQSFDNDVLSFLNRAHDSYMAVKCLDEARRIGFSNISLDLIYAIPGRDNDKWTDDLNLALGFSPEHISSYSLTIEEKTVFGRWLNKRKISPVDEELSASQFELLIDRLEREGYEHYEVSNFSKPGFESRHNTSYWKQLPYLGIGPSAHSYNLESRQYNVCNNHLYLRSINQGIVPATLESLSVEDKINDYLLTTLRTSWGADIRKIKNSYGFDLIENQKDYVNLLLQKKLAVIQNNHLILTRQGKFLADKISAELFVGSAS